MEIMAAYYTDIGNEKLINEDSLYIRVVNSAKGKIGFAVICDGMGGLEQGELASKEVVMLFKYWFASDFIQMVTEDAVNERNLREKWTELVNGINKNLKGYSDEHDFIMGTTLSVLLVYRKKYYICHIGDSRIYWITRLIRRMTEDHTWVEQEVREGRMTTEQAKFDLRRNVLTQCVGVSKELKPQFVSGKIKGDTTFLLCSDGLVHMVSEDEMYQCFRPDRIRHKGQVASNCRELTRLAMNRGERDNITVMGLVCKNKKVCAGRV